MTILESRGRRARSHIDRQVDAHVGGRVRERRTMLGMSQEKLGEAIGLTFQQVQKYERGANRIGASRLWTLSRTLDVPISFFFDGLSQDGAGSTEEPPSQPQTRRVMRDFNSITDPDLRDSTAAMVGAAARLQRVR